jgi:hypothetical protein
LAVNNGTGVADACGQKASHQGRKHNEELHFRLLQPARADETARGYARQIAPLSGTNDPSRALTGHWMNCFEYFTFNDAILVLKADDIQCHNRCG